MNRLFQAVLVASATLALSACASSGGMASAPGPATGPQQGERILTDGEYVSAVERVARSRGVHVQWVNPPQRRFPAGLASR
ncbi:hypothetical protein [Luteimonas sp. MC1895]|uniref:hypothetical protein n=1 Tax=Luteimonas sp. MC1895 TaxID=2819513 RepID=UPI0018F0D320|nr:hypothetical protein [Luteimonas sp. MC1895]MBJ6979995.1 hypothetical protein [Luteimonas sp. MC1895]